MKRQVFIVWFLIFLIWAFYRAYFFQPEWIDELLVKPLVFVFPVLFMVWYYENKPLAELGLTFKLKNIILDIYVGVVLGILLAFEGLIANYLKYGNFTFSPLAAAKMYGDIGIFLIVNLISAISEEILGRGYLYNRLFRITNRQFWSALFSSILFLLLHLPIMFTRLHLTGGALVIYPVSILILGITNCYLFTLRRSLTIPILLHTFWNMTIALYL